MEEVWKEVKGYGGRYKISSFGNVFSVGRIDSTNHFVHSQKRSGCVNSRGYINMGLSFDGLTKTHMAHTLVASHFIDSYNNGDIIDHIDGNKQNNRVENLRIVSSIENNWNKSKMKTKKTSSKFKGVCWDKSRNKWIASICLYGKRKTIGRFNSEIEAAKAYDREALISFGEYAKTNKDMGLY